MIETGLVYIHSTRPETRFVGCGAVIEGGYIATCRHVWQMATAQGDWRTDEPPEVEIEYPRSQDSDGNKIRKPARLKDACKHLDHPAPDLVLLLPADIPSGVMSLQLAVAERFEVGTAFAHARLSRLDGQKRPVWKDAFPAGEIDPNRTDEGLRQFTGTSMQGYWFTRGSSGAPLFQTGGQQLAGILSVSELGANEGNSPLQVAFVVPATTIHRYMARLVAKPVAADERISLADLQPILDAIGAQNVPLAEIPGRLKEFVDAARARAAEPINSSSDGADIDSVIGASRRKLRALDSQGARELLQAKIVKEHQARTRRLVPLLRERGEIERLAFDYEAAKSTFAEITALVPDEAWAWGALGDLWNTTGPLENALAAYRRAEAAARRAGDERDLSVSHERIGDVLLAEGDREAALLAYRAGLAIRETLAHRDPGNAGWQRDLSASHARIGDVLLAEGDRKAALAAYRAGLAIAETLARRDPGNAGWQRDLSVSNNRIGDVLLAEGDRKAALAAYRAGLAIAETLARRDPGNAGWQRDLSVSNNKVGDVLLAEGDRKAALAAYRAGLAIRETLARRDPGNAGWQRDLSVSNNKIADVLLAEGERKAALAAYRAGLAIAETLARRDPGNAEWQRDLSVSNNRIGDVLLAEGDREAALKAYRAGLAIRETLARRDPDNAGWQRDLIVSYVRIAESDPAAAVAVLSRAFDIACRLQSEGRLAPVDAWIPEELARHLSSAQGSAEQGGRRAGKP